MKKSELKAIIKEMILQEGSRGYNDLMELFDTLDGLRHSQWNEIEQYASENKDWDKKVTKAADELFDLLSKVI